MNAATPSWEIEYPTQQGSNQRSPLTKLRGQFSAKDGGLMAGEYVPG